MTSSDKKFRKNFDKFKKFDKHNRYEKNDKPKKIDKDKKHFKSKPFKETDQKSKRVESYSKSHGDKKFKRFHKNENSFGRKNSSSTEHPHKFKKASRFKNDQEDFRKNKKFKDFKRFEKPKAPRQFDHFPSKSETPKFSEVHHTSDQAISESFASFHLCKTLQDSLVRLGFSSPTPIQQKSIPLALKGHDILGSAQTGTGKTYAFALPILEKMFSSSDGSALILAPTRELAAQIQKAFHDLLPKKSHIKTALLIGGEHIGKQFRELKMHPRIIIGTPGRINDHLDRNSLQLHEVMYLVLDEADRMMDMGFEPQINTIIQLLPNERQTFMYSATFSSTVIKLSHRYLQNPIRISVGEQHQVTLNIRQEMIPTKSASKYSTLIKELDKREGHIIIFVKTKRGAEELADKLCNDDHSADALHGDLHQRKRDKVILAFRKKHHRILVATDVAARGLDIPHIEHVINYDLPQSPEDYMHRIGRTARAGKKGEALSFVTSADNKKWKDICRFIQKKPDDNKKGKKHRRK